MRWKGGFITAVNHGTYNRRFFLLVELFFITLLLRFRTPANDSQNHGNLWGFGRPTKLYPKIDGSSDNLENRQGFQNRTEPVFEKEKKIRTVESTQPNLCYKAGWFWRRRGHLESSSALFRYCGLRDVFRERRVFARILVMPAYH